MIRSDDSALRKTAVSRLRRRTSPKARSRILLMQIRQELLREAEAVEQALLQAANGTLRLTKHLARQALKRRVASVRDGAPKITLASPIHAGRW
jgi:histone H3/H4